MAEEMEFLVTDRDEDRPIVRLLGAWTIDHAEELAAAVDGLEVGEDSAPRVDAERLEDLDTLGAWLLAGVCERLRTEEGAPELAGTNERQQALLEEVQDKRAALVEVEPERRSPGKALGDGVAGLGRHIVVGLAEGRDFLIFVGETLVCVVQIALRRQRFSFASLLHHVEQVWISALPIVGLLGFLSGAVIVYQGTTQLQRFGASTLAINMVGIVVLREIGVLLAALLVGGRSGSSFAAQIGAMKAQREVDAMLASGIDPTAALVVPRIAALLITFPLLGFFSTVMALVGGGLMAWFELGLGPSAYMARLHEAVTPSTFYVGMIKTPVFASIIALIGCFQGLRVEGTAAEVGRLTTRSVVQTIFLIITVDALFTIFFRFVNI
jgi:phospholipid/cholesterol/gamma-HCH transport system permease protein